MEPSAKQAGGQANIIPGADALGFGIDVTVAEDWTQQTSRLVELGEEDATPIFEPADGSNRTKYLLPDNVSHIDLWKTDANYQAFDSRLAYAEQMAAQADISASRWGFSGQFNASFTDISEGLEAASYGSARLQSQMWELAIDDLAGLSLDPTFDSELSGLPKEFTAATRDQFVAFLQKWGTHVVTSVIVGGSLEYSVVVSAAFTYTESQLAANLQCEYDSLFLDSSGAANADWKKIESRWVGSRRAALKAVGGTPDLFDEFVPPSTTPQPPSQNELFKKWSNSVVETPAVIGARLQPVSSLAPLARTESLRAALSAYLNASVVVSATMVSEKKSPFKSLESSTMVIVGETDVQPLSQPGAGFQPMYWIVLAEADGTITFNQNALVDKSGEFDKLVMAADAAITSQTYWVVVAATGVSGPISAKAAQWLSSCGISLGGEWGSYENTKQMLAAVGMTHSRGFGPAVAELIKAESWPHAVRTAELPLYAGSQLA